MTKFQRTAVVASLGIIAFFILLGFVGHQDHVEYVILHMSQEEYDTISQRLTDETGTHPSDSDIADYWLEHQK